MSDSTRIGDAVGLEEIADVWDGEGRLGKGPFGKCEVFVNAQSVGSHY